MMGFPKDKNFSMLCSSICSCACIHSNILKPLTRFHILLQVFGKGSLVLTQHVIFYLLFTARTVLTPQGFGISQNIAKRSTKTEKTFALERGGLASADAKASNLLGYSWCHQAGSGGQLWGSKFRLIFLFSTAIISDQVLFELSYLELNVKMLVIGNCRWSNSWDLVWWETVGA